MSYTHSIVVAIDGPGGAGKSTVAKTLAKRLGYSLLDTGAMYRAVALLADRGGVDPSNVGRLAEIAAGLDLRFAFNGEDNCVFLGAEDVTSAIRTPEMSLKASQVSALGPVRGALMDAQRRLGRGGRVVAEGRDVGTVVFPDAPAKFFLTASDQERARRRHRELQATGIEVDFGETLRELQDRDARDSQREVAPLMKAPDAHLIDSTGRAIDDVIAEMLGIVQRSGDRGDNRVAH